MTFLGSSRQKYWGEYFFAWFDALWLNKNGLTYPQRLIFLFLPFFGPGLFYLHRGASEGLLHTQVNWIFSSLEYVLSILLAGIIISIFAFRDRITKHKWSGDLSVSTRLIIIFAIVILIAIYSVSRQLLD